MLDVEKKLEATALKAWYLNYAPGDGSTYSFVATLSLESVHIGSVPAQGSYCPSLVLSRSDLQDWKARFYRFLQVPYDEYLSAVNTVFLNDHPYVDRISGEFAVERNLTVVAALYCACWVLENGE